MKKIGYLINICLFLTMTFLFSACSSAENNNDAGQNDKTINQSTALEKIDRKSSCLKSGGEWKLMSNSCGDICRPKSGERLLCAMMMQDNCDCGPDKCFDQNRGLCINE